jgi:hypothetical protein
MDAATWAHEERFATTIARLRHRTAVNELVTYRTRHYAAGLNMSGHWVGLGFDGRIMCGWASMGQTRRESEKTMTCLISSEGVACVND